MPNWCYNRITIYGDSETEAKLKEIEEIFEKADPFNQIFPIPDFKNIPDEKGELPKLEQKLKQNLRRLKQSLRKLTHLIKFFPSLILRTSRMKKENYLNLNNTRMIRGRLFGRHIISQMERMMIDGIIGVLITVEESVMLATNLLSMKTQRFLHLHSILRGVHPKELLKSCVKDTQSYHSNVSMMNQEWNQQGITRTVCKLSAWGCMRNPIPL